MKAAALLLVALAAPASELHARATLELTATPEMAGTAALTLAVTNDTGERPDIYGFDVYRLEYVPGLADPCLVHVPVTEETIPRPSETASYSFQIADQGLEAGHVYQYIVECRVTEPNGPHWSSAFDPAGRWAVITTGQAVIAEAARIYEFGGGMSLSDCLACSPFLGLVGSAPSEIVNNGAWRLFGTVRPRPDVYRFEWVVEAAVATECRPFAVVPSMWGNVKARYR